MFHEQLLGHRQTVPTRAIAYTLAIHLPVSQGILSSRQQGGWQADEMFRAIPSDLWRGEPVRLGGGGRLDVVQVPQHIATVPHVRSSGSLADAQHPDLVSRVTALRELLRNEQIFAARRMLDSVSLPTLEEPAINRLRRALAPPVVRPSQRKDMDRTQTFVWLRRHAGQYQGQWVAVGEGGLIAAAPTLKELRERLRSLELPAERPLIHKL